MKNLSRELRVAKELALKAGLAVMEIYQKKAAVKYKSKNDPVTPADIMSNDIIITGLKKFNYGILSEETVDDKLRLKKDRVWIVDPLDGTNDFINRTGEFTIMIGLVESGRPILGVIYSPAEKILYYAIKSQGSFRKKAGKAVRLKVSAKASFGQAKVYVSRHHFSEIEKKFLESLGVKKIVACGSSKKLCLIAGGDGEANLNLSDKTWEWDICATDIILSQAGGRLTDKHGRKLKYNKKHPKNLDGYVASNGLMHEKIIKELANSLNLA